MKYQVFLLVIVSQISEFVHAANQNEFTTKTSSIQLTKNVNFGSNNNNNNPGPARKNVNLENSADIFQIKKPVEQKSPDYNQFLSFLYRNDIQKQKTIPSRNVRDISAKREKRALIFRPLFVYKQQEIKRQKVKETKQKGKGSKVTQKPVSKVQNKNG